MAEAQKSLNASKVHTHYEITRGELPLHCPMPNQSLWNSHPRVFLPIEETGKAKCPYCGAEYILKDK
ncbi:zinc-finger domain-containing protein [Sulfuriflexus mobilis]|uniref:zinc-finger domain-containing protein n=1 Tax=Sulfuriflexus mobilis TaxID=1811807 RepID=UPI000F819ABC|nr:zinc-finger domain-containing protein [Sulfuriflexus mobilis]